MMKTTAKEIIAYMESLQNEEQRRILMGFFKTGPGEYGEGDEFLGLKVPQTREVVQAVPKDFPLSEIPRRLSVAAMRFLPFIFSMQSKPTIGILSTSPSTKSLAIGCCCLQILATKTTR